MRCEKLVVVGQGYVGLPLAVRAVDAGFDVVGLDVDPVRVKRLRAADSYIADVPSTRLATALATGRYLPSGDYADAAGFDLCVISVPTPLRDGTPDLAHVSGAAASLAPHLRRGATVILESTTLPGTTEDLLLPLLEEATGLRCPGEFHLGYSPERIDPGNPAWHLGNTPKVVSGVDAAALARVDGFYRRIVERTVPVDSTRVAELAKLIENTFRQVNIALVNELAGVARDLGVDVWDALDAAATKPFGYLPFRPGPGVGGHCLPVDAHYLSWHVRRRLGRRLRLVELANDINGAMPAQVVRRVADGLTARGRTVAGSRILLLGLAYKKNSADMRGSPGTEVAARLIRLGAHVVAVEPHADLGDLPPGVGLVGLCEAQVRAAQAVVLLTDHDAVDYGLVERHAGYVFDARGRCRGPAVERL